MSKKTRFSTKNKSFTTPDKTEKPQI